MAHKNSSNWSPYKARQKSNSSSGSPQKSQGHPSQKSQRSHHKKPLETYTFNEADDRVFSVFRNHGFSKVPHSDRQQLTRFYQLLMENQKKENFTRLLNLRDVAIKHFIDCLMIPRLTQLKFPLLDVGTGPGFPGIPLKIHFPKEKIILAEGVQKRVEFLKTVRDELELKNLDILGRNINADCFYPVQGVITRAVEDARNTLGNVMSCLQTGGRVYLMKGPGCDPEIEPALNTWGEYYKLVEDIAYQLPSTPHDRRLLVFEKYRATPLRDLNQALENEGDWDEN